MGLFYSCSTTKSCSKSKKKKTPKTVTYILPLKHKTKNHLGLTCVQHTAYIPVLIQTCILPLKVYVFSEQRDQTPIKMDGPSDTASQNASVTISSKFCIQNSFKSAGQDGPTS